MAYIRLLSNGKFKAEICKKQTLIKIKTFPIKQDAIAWGDEIDS